MVVLYVDVSSRRTVVCISPRTKGFRTEHSSQRLFIVQPAKDVFVLFYLMMSAYLRLESYELVIQPLPRNTVLGQLWKWAQGLYAQRDRQHPAQNITVSLPRGWIQEIKRM